MRRLTNPRSIAAAILDIVRSGEHYDQGSWFSSVYFSAVEDHVLTVGQLRQVFKRKVCGSTACVAGNAVVLTLHRNDKYDCIYNVVVFADGSRQDVASYAGDVLGLTRWEARWLFNSHRDVDEVIEALELLAAGKSISGLVTEDDDDF